MAVQVVNVSLSGKTFFTTCMAGQERLQLLWARGAAPAPLPRQTGRPQGQTDHPSALSLDCAHMAFSLI